MKRSTLLTLLLTTSFAGTALLVQAADQPVRRASPTSPPPPQVKVQTDKTKVQTTTPPAPQAPGVSVTTPQPPAVSVSVPQPPPVSVGLPQPPAVSIPAPQPPEVKVTTPQKPIPAPKPEATGKVTLNHKGKIITVDQNAVKAHLAHGDTVVSGHGTQDHEKGKGKGKNKGKKGE